MAFFKEITKEGQDYVECKLCSCQLKYCGSSTTNMGKHIKNKHMQEYNKIKDTGFLKENTKISSYVTITAQWKRDAKSTVEWERKIVQFVVATNQSLSVVENPYFRALLPKEFVPPCRKTFTDVCLDTCFEQTKQRLLFDIKNILVNT